MMSGKVSELKELNFKVRIALLRHTMNGLLTCGQRHLNLERLVDIQMHKSENLQVSGLTLTTF